MDKIALSVIAYPFSVEAGPGQCGFNKTVLVFAGDTGEQTRCLLSPVMKFAKLGEALTVLPNFLNGELGQQIDVPVDAFHAHLTSTGLSETQVGGALDAPLSETMGGKPALYFVIHDTSTPYFATRQ